jgi:hypothetical protein
VKRLLLTEKRCKEHVDRIAEDRRWNYKSKNDTEIKEMVGKEFMRL